MRDLYPIDPAEFVQRETVPFSSHIGPLFYHRQIGTLGVEKGKEVGWVGIAIDDHHIGGADRGHGGLLMTILDEAMGMNASFQKEHTPVVTVSMQINFVGSPAKGEFLQATARVSETTKSMAFMEGKAWSGGRLVGTASGVWKYFHKAPKMPTMEEIVEFNK